MKLKSLATVIMVSILTLIVVNGTSGVTAYVPIPSNLNEGPYVDYVDYLVISNENQRVLALQAGTIDMDTSFFDPVYYNTLVADPDVSVYSALRNGYGQITINCRDYPLSISALRRAFAFAYNKTEIIADAFDGFGQEHDSLVPITNGWCVEDQFLYHYYTANADTGNAILDAAGFAVDGGTGFRNAPNGSAFDITIEYAASSPTIGGVVAQAAVDALTALQIDAHAQAADFNNYISRLDNHGDYDMIFYASQFYSNDVDWLAYEYWSAYADVPYQNPSNFANATYDSCRNQLLYGTTFDDVFEASAEMQRILQYNVPRLVVYENTYLQGYRTDEFTGYVEDLGRYIAGPWTMRKIHNLDGTPGGTVSVAIAQEPDTFNIFTTNSQYSAAILTNLYSSLYKYGPDLAPWPDLAESVLVETHAENAAVPTGHTRYTIDIIQNASWSDGMPLTAEDVAYTFTYAVESYAYGNPAGADLGDLVAAYAPSTYRVILEFSTESYWQFSDFAFDYIIPEHIFQDIGYDGWNDWNPVFSSDPQVTSGPFQFVSYSTGDWYRIGKNPLYYYLPPNPAPVVESAQDITYVEGTTGHYITWEVSDDNPFLYTIIKDDDPTPVVSDTWDGSDITLNVDGLSVGTYNYTLAVFDYSANFVFSSILVTVTPASSSTTTTTTTTNTTTTSGTGGLPINSNLLLIAVGLVAVVAVVIVLILKYKPS